MPDNQALLRKPSRRELLALARMAFDAADAIEVEAIERGAWTPLAQVSAA